VQEARQQHAVKTKADVQQQQIIVIKHWQSGVDSTLVK